MKNQHTSGKLLDFMNRDNKVIKLSQLKFVFSKNQIDGEDFVNFCGLLRKHELYNIITSLVHFDQNMSFTKCVILNEYINEMIIIYR